MPEENQLAGNLLQEREQADREAAAKGQTPASTQPVYNPLLGVTQRQFMQIMAGNDPSKPMVSTDKYGTPQFHFENYGQNTPTQVQTNQFGQTYVPAVDEAFKQNAEQISQELEDFHYAFAPELAKDRQRSSYFNESLQAVPTFISEAGKSAGAMAMHTAHGLLAQNRNYQELKWNFTKTENASDPDFQIAGAEVKRMEDAGFSPMAIASMDVDDLNISDKAKGYLKQYQQLEASRISDERRMRIAMAYEQDKTNIETAMHNSTWLKPLGGDEETTINSIAKMSGQVAGSVAMFYLTGRAVGLAGSSISRARSLIAGANSADKAAKAVGLAQAGGTDAFLAAAANIGEKYVFFPSFLTQYDSIRTQSLLAGKSIAEANAIGFVAGVAEGALELAGFKWFKRFYTDGGWFKNYVIRNIIPESLQEGSQTLAENTITQLTGVTDKQWEDIMSEVGLSIVAGALGGGMFSFWRAKTLGADAWAANMAENLANKWGNLNKQQINQVVDVVHQAVDVNEREGKETKDYAKMFAEKNAETAKDKPGTQQYLEAYKSLSEEQKTAAKEYLSAINELKDHYTKRVTEKNPKVTEAQLRNGWKHVRAQVLAQKDNNLLVQTYEGSINQVAAYLKPDSQTVEQNTKAISDKLFKSGFTEDQVKDLMSGETLKYHEKRWKIATDYVERQAQAMGVSEAESKVIANTIKYLAYDATLTSGSRGVAEIVKKITDNLINTQIATLHGQNLPALFANILEEIEPNRFTNTTLQEQIQTATDIVSMLEANERGEDIDMEIAQTLFGDPEQAQDIGRLKNSLFAQAELVANVIDHMPVNATKPDATTARAMTLLKFMGNGWDTILPAFGISANTEESMNDAFNRVAEEYYPALDERKMAYLETLDENTKEDTSLPAGMETSQEAPLSEETVKQIQQGTGFYEADENTAVLTAPRTGTAIHEVNHLSLSYLVTSATALESAGLLSDMHPIHRIYAYMRNAIKTEGLELTQRQLQETLNDAVNDFLATGQSSDPVITGLLNELRANGLKRYKRLIGSKYGQQGGKGGLTEEQKKAVRGMAQEMVSGTTPGTMLADAYRLQAEANLEAMPEDFNTADQTALAKWGEQIKDFGHKYPLNTEVEDAMIDAAVKSGNAIVLATAAQSLAAKAIETATDAFIESRSFNEEGELNRVDDQIFFEADAAAMTPDQAKQTLTNLGFRKEQSFGEAVKDIEWSKTGSLLATAGKNFFQSLEGAANELDKALGKDKQAKGSLTSIIMRQFYDAGIRLQEFREVAKPMVDAVDKHFKPLKLAGRDAEVLEWYKKFHLVLRQGNSGAYKKAGDFLESKLGKEARKSYDASIEKLKEATEMMKRAGVPAELLAWEGDFFPFAVKDFDKFVREFLGHAQAFSNNEKERARFIEEYRKKHPEETEENMAKLYVALVDNQNALFQRNADNESKVTSFFKRRVHVNNDEDPTIFEYYKDPFDTLDRYMETAYRTVMMRNLIGKVTYTEDGTPILLGGSGQVGQYIANIPEGAVPADVLENFENKMKALAARDAGDKNTLFDLMRQVNQMTTLGSFFNAINQVMDIPFILTMFGPKAVNEAIGDMMSKAGKSLTLEDVGAQSANEVFRVQDEALLAKATKKVFKWTGFEWTDRKIKELAINAAAKWAQNTLKVAHTGTDRQVVDNAQDRADLYYVIDECFPAFDRRMVPQGMSEEEVAKVEQERNAKRNAMIKALENGGKNPDGTWNNDAKYVYWFMLTKLQPINAATVSANYNKVGALGKSMYQFSTVATRQMGFIGDYWRMKMKTGGAKAAAAGMIKFVAFCMAIGVPKEVIEAVLKGRGPDVAGSFVMSPLHVIMLNEYTLQLAKREGIPSALFRTWSAKFNVGDNITRDTINFLSGKDFKFNTSKNIPVLGAFMYAWMFGGREQTIRSGKDIFGQKYNPEKARQVRESNRQKEESLNFMQEVF